MTTFETVRIAAVPDTSVVLDADGMDTETMQLVAAETNYSETTFVSSRPEADGMATITSSTCSGRSSSAPSTPRA